MVHIPVAVRAELALISAVNLEDAAHGDARGAILERVVPRLLLAPVPPSERVDGEVRARVALWNQGAFSELLMRIEVMSWRVSGRPVYG